MRTLYLSFSLLLISIASYSQTNISGSIFSNTTWTASASPYIVTGNIVVFSGVILTVNPGVIIKFNPGTGLELRGKLIAIGTSTDSIEFTSNSSTPTIGSWNGITVIGNTNPLGVGNQVMMDYVKGSYANYFIDLNYAYHGPYIFKHCCFSYNNTVNKDGGMPSTIFENCKFISNNLGLEYCQFYSRVSNSSFINNVNGLNGIANVDTCYFSGNTGVALSPYGSTIGCTVENNNTGVSCYFNDVNNLFIKNNISNNVIGVELLTYFDGEITFTNNTICNNSNYNIKLLTQNNADLSNNCWCSIDSSYIRSKIYDGYINNNYGLVNFSPFVNCTLTTGTPEQSDQKTDLTIFPNPFNNKLEISVKNSDPVQVVLFDIFGRKILQQTFTATVTLNTQELENGIYIYNVSDVNGFFASGKVIKN